MNRIKILSMSSILLITVLLLNFSVVSAENISIDYIENVIHNLEKVDIVRDCRSKWNDDDYIKRRDIFEMIFIIKTGSRKLVDIEDIELFQEEKKTYYMDAEYFYKFTGFADVENDSYDDYLTHRLREHKLIQGKQNENGQIIAALDDYVTYEEVIAIIGRLFYEEVLLYDEYGEVLPDINSEDFYFELLNLKGVINSQADLYSITIDKTMMEEKANAYTVLCMLNKSLYIPTTLRGCWAAERGYYYINKFLKNEKMEADEYFIEITD